MSDEEPTGMTMSDAIDITNAAIEKNLQDHTETDRILLALNRGAITINGVKFVVEAVLDVRNERTFKWVPT